jgi:tRNA 2-thiouridine synthesizing protein A
MSEAKGSGEVLWESAREYDLTGLKCPLPALLTAKTLRDLAAGSLVAVTVTDPLAPLDIRHFCQRDGHEVLDQRQNETGAQRLLIRRGPRS